MKNITTLIIASIILPGCFAVVESRKNLFLNAPQTRPGAPWHLVESTDEITGQRSATLTSPIATIKNYKGERESTRSFLAFDCSSNPPLMKIFNPESTPARFNTTSPTGPSHITEISIDGKPPFNIYLDQRGGFGWYSTFNTKLRDTSLPEKYMNAREVKMRFQGVYTYDVSGFTPADCPNQT